MRPSNAGGPGLRRCLLVAAVAAATAGIADAAKPKKPPSIAARAAFVQQVGDEGGAPLLHLPRDITNRMNARQLGTAIARVLSLDARAEVGVSLPAGDLFHRPDANLVVFVDGVSVGVLPWREAMPALHATFNSQNSDSVFAITLEGRASTATVLESALSSDTLSSATAKGTTLLSSTTCADTDGSLRLTAACGGAATLGSLPAAPTAADLAALGLQGTYNEAERTWSIAPADATGSSAAPATLWMGSSVDAGVMQELALLAALRTRLAAPARRTPRGPALSIVSLSSLRASAEAYGARHAKTAAAASLLDTALSAALAPQEGVTVTAQLVAGPKLAPIVHEVGDWSWAVGRRLQTNTTTNTTIPLVDISQYQLNLWTGVFLALLVFAAIFGIVTMDIGRDSLLYAKFQADTSGKND